MTFFPWSIRYNVGVPAIDEQHMRLVDLINALHEAATWNNEHNTIPSTIDELETMDEVLVALIDYTSSHFSFEERCMVQHSYPDYEEHKHAHTEFIRRIRQYRRDFDNGSALRSSEMMRFLRDWLTTHILGLDKKLAVFLNEKAVARAP